MDSTEAALSRSLNPLDDYFANVRAQRVAVTGTHLYPRGPIDTPVQAPSELRCANACRPGAEPRLPFSWCC